MAFFLVGAVVLAAVSLWTWLREPTIPEFEPRAQSDVVERSLSELTPVNAWKSWIVVYRPLAERGFAPLERVNAPMIRAEIAQTVSGSCIVIRRRRLHWLGGDRSAVAKWKEEGEARRGGDKEMKGIACPLVSHSHPSILHYFPAYRLSESFFLISSFNRCSTDCLSVFSRILRDHSFRALLAPAAPCSK